MNRADNKLSADLQVHNPLMALDNQPSCNRHADPGEKSLWKLEVLPAWRAHQNAQGYK